MKRYFVYQAEKQCLTERTGNTQGDVHFTSTSKVKCVERHLSGWLTHGLDHKQNKKAAKHNEWERPVPFSNNPSNVTSMDILTWAANKPTLSPGSASDWTCLSRKRLSKLSTFSPLASANLGKPKTGCDEMKHTYQTSASEQLFSQEQWFYDITDGVWPYLSLSLDDSVDDRSPRLTARCV